MDQLHPSNKEFEQMDIFPGPLAEDVSDETILEYIDDRLKRSETPTSANEAEDENERLLLGVLRVIVKCNGKLRSDPGISNPTDPTAPEAQLVAVLSESSQRRNGNQSAVFPAPRKVQSATHPDLAVKHANELRQQLLIGDRKGAVSTAMNAHMWPEAMLIASFTDKDEYRRVLRMYLDEHYATGDPSRALFMAFADQQDKSVQEPKRLLQTHDQSAASLILSSWVSHAQILIANRTADTNKILTELGDRLWNEESSVAAAHVCYLLAGIQVEAPMPSSKIALLGGDHRTPKEARFYVSPAAVQRTEVYEWAQKHSRGASGNLMIPFQGYKLIYAMLLADHGKLETAFKYVTSMLAVIKAVTATMKPGTSMYLEGMKNQLTVLDDRLRQHLGQDRVASVAASTSRGGGRKQGGKWGLGNALSIMGKIVNRVVEGNDSNAAAPSESSATTSGGLYASEAAPPAASYPNAPSVTAPSPSPTPSYLQHQVQQTPPPSSHGPSSHGPSPMNPEAKVAKLGEQMDAYFDEETKRWVFPGEAASEEPTMPTAPPKGPLPGSAPGSMATGAPPIGTTNSAPGSISSGAPSSNDPLAALMAPPPSHMLMKKDPLAAMMAPPARAMGYGPQRSGSAGPRKPPRPQFAVFKPSAASAPDQTEQSAPDQ
ncbi:Protein transport protein Sec16B [Phytophthora boehmeriae]|uniref:Protein transport protein sec16 n=1 Tax=Phytophthora boehmeriae TaxID=109152 RepID=A0A8T1WPT9_9STRA|nr:Protein transport protein Sec16B [Phytophthora boehmeriae]